MSTPTRLLAAGTVRGRPVLQEYDVATDRMVLCASIVLDASPQYVLADADRGVLLALTRDPDGHCLQAMQRRGDEWTITARADTFPVPVHLSEDCQTGIVYTSHYRDGQVTAHRWGTDGTLDRLDVIAGFGSGPHPRQASTHAHGTAATEDRVYVADFGADAVRCYLRSGSTHTLVASWNAPPSSGPRHLAILPDGHVAVLTELGGRVHILDGVDLAERVVGGERALPADYSAHDQASDLRLVLGGRALLTGHRGHDSLAIHSLDGPRTRVIGRFELRGSPRSIDHAGSLVAVAAEDTGWVQICEWVGGSLRERFAVQLDGGAAAVAFIPPRAGEN